MCTVFFLLSTDQSFIVICLMFLPPLLNYKQVLYKCFSSAELTNPREYLLDPNLRHIAFRVKCYD